MWERLLNEENVVNSAIAIGVLLLFIIFRKVFSKYIFSVILKLSRKAQNSFFSNVLIAFEKPFQLFFVVIGIYFAIDYFPFYNRTDPLFIHLFRSSIVLLIAWGLYNLSDATSSLFVHVNKRFHIELDNIVVPFFSKALRFIIIAISLSIIAQEFNYDVNGFIAGLGLGGLAFALAAKDAIANLFGGLIIITEKPFTIGDWIDTPSVEGTVEDISFRSTKVRTFAQALVTVPNATLANEAIVNWSKMEKRRVSFNLRIAPTTSRQQAERAVRRIRQLLTESSDIHPETIFVSLDDFSENGFNILFYYFTVTVQWGDYLHIKEQMNFEIMDILREEQIDYAIPNYQVVVEKREHPIQ